MTTFYDIERGLTNAMGFLCARSTMYWKGEIEAIEFALAWLRGNREEITAFLEVEDCRCAECLNPTQIWPEIGI
ncbi:MAG: hypothetical protein EP299_01820 [Acidobacteria bacterium]|nr:MAG: hypothetical protein EP299_01820 [Acidobacteriota bacterium]